MSLIGKGERKSPYLTLTSYCLTFIAAAYAHLAMVAFCRLEPTPSTSTKGTRSLAEAVSKRTAGSRREHSSRCT